MAREKKPVHKVVMTEGVYSCAGVPLFRRNGNRQSGGRKPLNRNRGGCKIKCVSLRRESSKLTHFVSFTECDKITGKD